MHIQVITFPGRPVFRVSSTIKKAREIDVIVKARYGVQDNLSPHNWVGLDPKDAVVQSIKIDQ